MPRLPPKWPPTFDTVSMIVSRISCASCGSCLRSSLRTSAGVSISSRIRVMSSAPSGAAFADVTCYVREIVHRTGHLISVGHGDCEQLPRSLACRFDADQRGIRQLSLRDIFACGLYKRFRALFDVEQIVDDLCRV